MPLLIACALVHLTNWPFYGRVPIGLARRRMTMDHSVAASDPLRLGTSGLITAVDIGRRHLAHPQYVRARAEGV